MENSEINLNHPIVQLEVMKEKLKHAEEENSQQEESLKQAHVTIGKLDERLRQATEDSHTMKVTLEVTKQKLTHAEQALTLSSQQTTSTDRQKKWRVFLASIFFAIASVLIGIGSSQIAATPPNAFGDVLIGLGIVAYIVATTLNILLT